MNFLFITHDTSLSGAPKTMLLFFKELVKLGHKFDVITLGEGELENEYRCIATNFFSVGKLSRHFNYDIKSRIFKKFFNKDFISEYSLFSSGI